MPVLHYLYHCSFVVTFETRKCKSFNFVLLFQDCSGYSEFLAFPYKFQGQLVNFCPKGSWNLDMNCTESIDQFGEHCHLDNIVFQSMKRGCLSTYSGYL